jgi:hypothetical protein
MEDCCQYRPEICRDDFEGTAQWECRQGACYAHPAEEIQISGKPLNPAASYKMATNDYIANGGSGFTVLRRNTTKVNTGIAMRDTLVEYLRKFPTCHELLRADPNQVDTYSLAYCLEHESEQAQRNIVVKGSCTCGDVLDAHPQAGSDSAGQAIDQDIFRKCGSVGPALLQFCQNPLDYPIVVGEPDGRITRKVN